MTQEVKLPQAAPWGDHTPSDQLQRSDLLKVLSDLQNWDYRSRPMPPILREFPSMTTERRRLRLAWMTPNPSGLVVDPGGYPLLQLAREPNDRSRSGLCGSQRSLFWLCRMVKNCRHNGFPD